MSAREYPWQQAQWRRLSEARARGRLPHAILLSGTPGTGKSAFAARLADALLCPSPTGSGDACGNCNACRQAAAGTHPDLLRVSPEEPGKKIRIDAIRSLSSRSVLAAQAGGFRVSLIEPADALNHAAANALLKTLEEPVSQAVLILVSSHPDRLPATIRSRCQITRFPLPTASECRDWLASQTEESELDQLLAVSGGAPLRALQAREEDWVGADHSLSSELAALKERKTNPVNLVEEWEQRPLSLLLEGLKRCLSDLIRLGADAAHGTLFHPGERENLQRLGQGIDLKSLFDLKDELFELERVSSNNLNASMMLEHIVNRWLLITRPGVRRL